MRKLYTIVFSLLIVQSCATRAPISERPLDLPFVKIFEGDFDSVWAATVNVLDIYSITLARRESGQIETDWSSARFNSDLYEYPLKNPFLEEVKYRIKIKLSKGVVAENNRPAVRVQVIKELSAYKDFITDWQRVPTDHFEESVILYRIGQRIKVSDAINRKKLNSQRDPNPPAN